MNKLNSKDELMKTIQSLSKSIEQMQSDRKKIVEHELLIAFKKCEESANKFLVMSNTGAYTYSRDIADVIKNISTTHKAQI